MAGFEVACGSLLLALCALAISRSKPERNPPGPKPLPIVGNLFDNPLKNARDKHVKWKEQYGDIIYFNIMGTRIVVLNSFKTCADLLDKRSAKYSSRPRLVMLNELMGWDHSFILMPYSARWRSHRRLFHQFFDEGMSATYRPIQERNTYRMLQRLLEEPNRLDEHIRILFGGSVLEIVYGIRVEGLHNRFLKMAEDALATAILPGIPGQFLVDAVPILKYVPSWFPGAGFKRQAAEWRKVAAAHREEPFLHVKENIEQGTAIPSMVASVLSNSNEKSSKGSSVDEEPPQEAVKGCAAATYIAGADSSLSTIQALFMAMANYPEAQKTAQAELDALLGGTRLPTFEDQGDLPFVDAIIKELLRWHNVAPMAVAHMLTEDDEYDGYLLRKGTIVLGNTWLILHDPEIYPEPMKFNPWRWLIETPEGFKINEAVPDPGLAAFGYGRRVCPGRHFGYNSLFISVASILTCFDIRALDAAGKPAERVEEFFTDGLVSYPAPFNVSITPRSQEIIRLIKDVPTDD